MNLTKAIETARQIRDQRAILDVAWPSIERNLRAEWTAAGRATGGISFAWACDDRCRRSFGFAPSGVLYATHVIAPELVTIVAGLTDDGRLR